MTKLIAVFRSSVNAPKKRLKIDVKALQLQVGSGEIPVDEEEWEDAEGPVEEFLGCIASDVPEVGRSPSLRSGRRRSSLICPIYNVGTCV
jgi:hypothetical protein